MIMSSYVYNKSANGTTYVYLNESFWDRDARKTRHKRKCVGKLDPATLEIVPTSRARAGSQDLGPEALPAAYAQASCRARILGPSLLLDKAARETGLLEDLKEVFRAGDALKILSCAYFLASENKPLRFIEQWSCGSMHPWQEALPVEAVRGLLGKITPALCEKFFQRRRARHPGALSVLEVASVASYSELIDSLRHGTGSGGALSGEIRLLMFLDSEGMPVGYKLLDAAVDAVAALKESLANSCLFASRDFRVVMGKGAFSEENIRALEAENYRFTMELPLAASAFSGAVEKAKDLIALNPGRGKGASLGFATQPYRLGAKVYYLHAYHDRERAELDQDAFSQDLKAYYKSLVAGTAQGREQGFYDQFFTVRDFPKRGLSVRYRDEAIRAYKHNAGGWLVLLTNYLADAEAALELYRKSVFVEKSFENLRNASDIKSLRLYAPEAVSRRIFLQFIALALVSYLKSFIKEGEAGRNYRLQEFFSELKSVQRISFAACHAEFTTVFTKKQQEIFALYNLRV